MIMTKREPAISDLICRFVANSTFEQLPDATRAAAVRVILDATGVMFGASGLSPDVQPFIGLASSAGDGPCAILGTGQRTTAAMAAFANGAMAHALDFEDAFDAAPGHPNAAAVPAAIAIAQSCGPIPGREFITAIAVGCDVACRIALSLRQPMEQNGWYPPPIIGAFGATAAAARLLGLDAVQTRDALSLTLCQATMPGEIKHSRRTVLRAVREAFPAQAAVLSASLARDGVSGFETPLEGKSGFFRLFADSRFDANDLTAGLGKHFYVENLSFKPWPACRGTHAYIEVALDLLRAHDVDWRDIESVYVDIGEVQQMLVEPADRKRAPQTVIDAKFSIPFTVAVALVHGEVNLASFTPAMLDDPDVIGMAQRVVARTRPGWGVQNAASGALALDLVDGRSLHGDVAQAAGHPDSPLSDEQLIAKFVHCCAYAANPVDAAAASGFAQRLLDIGNCADSGKLFS